jgi:hypothetical protein
MPSILRIGGLRVVIYPTDHRPAHVHVIGADGEAMFVLNCPNGPPELRESYGFKRSDLSAVVTALIKALAALCQE